MAEEWYVKLGSAVKGPMDATKLRALVLRGLVTPEVEVRKGSSRWVPAGKVRGLFERRKAEESQDESVQAASPLWPGWEGFTTESPPEAAVAPEADPLRALGLQGVAEAGTPDAPKRAEASPDSPIVVEVDEDPEPDPGPRPEAQPAPAAESPPVWNPLVPSEVPADAGIETPLLNLRIEEHESLHGEVGLLTPREGLAAPGKPGVADASEPSSRRRRAYLAYEGVVRSIGVLLFFNGFVGLVAAVLWAKQVLDRLPTLAGRGSDLRVYYITVLTEGMALLSLAAACFLLGAGLRSLQGWARWATATLMIEVVLVGFTVEMTCLIQANPRLLATAVSTLFVGMAMPGYVAQVMMRSEGEVVFSEAYREVVRRTPGIRAPWGLIVLGSLILEAAIVAMALYAAWKSIVAT